MTDLDYKELWSNLKVVLTFSLGVESFDKEGILVLMGKLETHQTAQNQANALMNNKEVQDRVLKDVKR